MRIVLDLTPLSHSRTGIGNFLLSMAAGLAEVVASEDELVAFSLAGPRSSRRVRLALAGLALEHRHVRVVPPAQPLRTLWSRLAWPPLERLVGDFDVFHYSDWMYPPQRGGLRATTIHDLVPLRYPEWVAPQTRKLHGRKYVNAAETSDLIVVNSRFTKGEVVDLLGVSAERVRVAHPGLDPRYGPDGDRDDMGGPYVLTVSTLEPRKNLATLVRAFAEVRRRHPDLRLAVAGATPGWAERAELDLPGVLSLGYVDDARLERLYRGASVFVYPSRYEGFGIPIVEALASGVPVVASSHPSMDEAAGDAALRADPDSAESFAEAIEAALAGEGPAEGGLAHAARFSRRAMGQAVLAAYRDAA